MQRLTKIGVFSLGKVSGLAGLLLGGLFGVIYGGGILIFGVIGAASGSDDAGGLLAMGIGGALLAVIALPAFYGLFSFVFGLIYGLIINVVLGLTGGLEIEIR